MTTDGSLPPEDERERVARRGIRWCVGCSRYTDGTYVCMPGGHSNGALCGPGCFKNCENILGRDGKRTRAEDIIALRRKGTDDP